MNSLTTRAAEERHVSANPPSLYERWAKKSVLQLMAKLEYGRIVLQDGDEIMEFGKDSAVHATVRVTDPRFYPKILFGGSIGAGEAYIDRMWEVDDLTALVRIMVLNMALLDRMEQGLAWLLYPARWLRARFQRNDRAGAKKNILAHYDLGNEMYKTFLDPTMMYSSARYGNGANDLTDASLYKLDLICRKLELRPTDRVVEIGAGWGGFAIHAAGNYGCHVTTTTISDAQYEEGRERIERAGLTDRITLLRKDYRELSGTFDKLVSIEMIEAVGHEFLPVFFRKCNELLKPDGRMLLQAITIRDQKYSQYRMGVDFIQHHVFPGGALPSNNVMFELITRHSDMVVRHLEDFGFDYARTIHAWRDRFNKAFPTLLRHGYDERFRRLWNFYLAYCEGGFLERAISVVHLLATKPDNRDPICI